MKTIGIFPASGGLGTSTYTHLLKLVPNDKVVLISRFPEKIPQAYVEAGATLRRASYESTAPELEAAFAGVDTLFLVSFPTIAHEYRYKVHVAAITAARRAGVTHIFYSSLAYTRPDSDTGLAHVMRAHLDTERHLRAVAAAAADSSAFTYTAIREGVYAESAPLLLGLFDPRAAAASAAAEFEIRIPHDGAPPGVAFVKRDELGEASARLIAEQAALPGARDFALANRIVQLTGPRALSLAETALALSETVVGRPVRIRQVSVEEFVSDEKVLARLGPEMGRQWTTSYDAIRAGELEVVTPDLEQVLGRAPTPFELVAKECWAE